jgi:hypothetical protein
MIEILNNNQGVIAIIAIVITIVGFFITNKNITKISQKQKSGDSSSNIQIGTISKEKDD